MSILTMDAIYFVDGIGQQSADVATGDPTVLGLLATALAGLVSSASPYIIPLVPGYVSYLTGISGVSGMQGNGVTTGVADATSVDKHDDDGGRGQRSSTARVGLVALLFALGFTVILVLGSAPTFGLVFTLHLQARTLTIVGGVVTIVMGLAFMGMVPALQKDARTAPKCWTTWLGAPLLSAVSALGWTPCLGPTLTAIISVSADTQGMTAARGAALTIAYCLGLGLSLILVVLGSARTMRGVDFLRKHSRTTQIIGGVALVLVGIVLVTGLWDVFVAWVQVALITDTVAPI